MEVCEVTPLVSAVEMLPLPRTISRIEGRSGGDCLRCCVAMVTGLPYEDVPDFPTLSPKAWSQAFQAWLNLRGAQFLRIGVDLTEAPASTPVIAIGRNTLGMHAVVIHEGLIDPAPSQQGLIEEPRHRLVVLPLAVG